MDNLLSLQKLKVRKVIAFDTNIITDFSKRRMNHFANELEKASKERFRFVLPDLCIAEALNYFDAKKPISPSAWENMARNLQKFVWKDFPILPSRKDFYAILGIKESPEYQSRFTSDYAKKLFEFFCNYPRVKDQEAQRRKDLQDDLEQARNHWRRLIDDIRSEFANKQQENCRLAQKIVVQKLLNDYNINLDTSFLGDIPLSECRALALEYVVSLATMPRNDGSFCYDQYADNHKNDGLDYLIMDALMAEVSICSNDGFFKNAKAHHRNGNSLAEQQLSLCLTQDDVKSLIQ